MSDRGFRLSEKSVLFTAQLDVKLREDLESQETDLMSAFGQIAKLVLGAPSSNVNTVLEANLV